MIDYQCSDLVDVPGFQQIVTSFHEASRIPIEITDFDGQIIFASSGQEILEKLHQFKQSRQYKKEQLPFNNEKRLQRYEYPGRLFQYARAIRINNQDFANLILGPVFHELPRVETFRQLGCTWIYNLQGYSEQSILGKTDADLYSPEDAARLTALKHRVMAETL